MVHGEAEPQRPFAASGVEIGERRLQVGHERPDGHRHVHLRRQHGQFAVTADLFVPELAVQADLDAASSSACRRSLCPVAAPSRCACCTARRPPRAAGGRPGACPSPCGGSQVRHVGEGLESVQVADGDVPVAGADHLVLVPQFAELLADGVGVRAHEAPSSPWVRSRREMMPSRNVWPCASASSTSTRTSLSRGGYPVKSTRRRFAQRKPPADHPGHRHVGLRARGQEVHELGAADDPQLGVATGGHGRRGAGRRRSPPSRRRCRRSRGCPRRAIRPFSRLAVTLATALRKRSTCVDRSPSRSRTLPPPYRRDVPSRRSSSR